MTRMTTRTVLRIARSSAWPLRGTRFLAVLAVALPAAAATRGSAQDHLANQLNAQELRRVTGAYPTYGAAARPYPPPGWYPPPPWYRPPPYPPPPGWYPPP